MYEYQTAHRDDKINIILRHDVDCRNASAMAGLEQKYGIKSTYYLRLHSACYDIRNWNHFYQNLEANGYEIGYHYEVVDLFLYSNDTARKVFEMELAYLRAYFNIRSVASHGGKYNYQFTQWTNVSEYGVVSAYSIPETVYLTDPNPQDLKTALGNLSPGDTFQILAPPTTGPAPEPFSKCAPWTAQRPERIFHVENQEAQILAKQFLRFRSDALSFLRSHGFSPSAFYTFMPAVDLFGTLPKPPRRTAVEISQITLTRASIEGLQNGHLIRRHSPDPCQS